MGTVKLPFYARLALTLLAIVLILFLLIQGRDIFIPLFFALLIAVLLYPVTRFLERIGMWRAPAAMISVFIFILLIAGFIAFFSMEIVNFSKDLPNLQARLSDIQKNIQHWIYIKYHINSSQQMTYVDKSTSSWISTAVSSVGNIFLSISGIIIWVIFIIIYTFFMLFHRKLLMKFILGLFKPEEKTKVAEVVQETKGVINSYVIGLLIEMIVVAVLNSTILGILGIKYAIFLGVLAAVLNIIPYLGIYSATAFSMLVTFANTGGHNALIVGIVFIIIHFFDANIMMPRIVGGRVKMNPFITIVAVIVGELLWGIPGMFLFIPLTAIIKIISERVESLTPWAILIGEDVKEDNTPEKAAEVKKQKPQ